MRKITVQFGFEESFTGRGISDSQNVEEHLLEIGMCSFKMERNVVIALSKVNHERKAEPEAENFLGVGQEGEMESWFDECAEIDSEVLLAEPVPSEAKSLLEQPVSSEAQNLLVKALKHCLGVNICKVCFQHADL